MPSACERFVAFRHSLSGRPPLRSDSLTGAAIGRKRRNDGDDWRPISSALSAPALVFHGTQDALAIGVGEDLARLTLEAWLTLVPDSGHKPFWEAPETFSPAAGSFLLARTLGPRRSAA
jgi:pimeloyl-ACP methyl ester carboxylesterase